MNKATNTKIEKGYYELEYKGHIIPIRAALYQTNEWFFVVNGERKGYYPKMIDAKKEAIKFIDSLN